MARGVGAMWPGSTHWPALRVRFNREAGTTTTTFHFWNWIAGSLRAEPDGTAGYFDYSLYTIVRCQCRAPLARWRVGGVPARSGSPRASHSHNFLRPRRDDVGKKSIDFCDSGASGDFSLRSAPSARRSNSIPTDSRRIRKSATLDADSRLDLSRGTAETTSRTAPRPLEKVERRVPLLRSLGLGWSLARWLIRVDPHRHQLGADPICRLIILLLARRRPPPKLTVDF